MCFFLVDCKGANVLIVYEYSDRRKIIIENSLWYIFKMSFYCHKPYNLIYKYMHMVWEKNRLVVNVIKVMGKSNTWLYNFFQSRPNFFSKSTLMFYLGTIHRRSELLQVHVENILIVYTVVTCFALFPSLYNYFFFHELLSGFHSIQFKFCSGYWIVIIKIFIEIFLLHTFYISRFT